MSRNSELYTSIKSLQIVDKTILDQCLAEANSASLDLHQVLLEHDLLKDENIGKLMADIYNLPFIKVSELQIPKSTIDLIPEKFARTYLCLVIDAESNHYKIAISDPDNTALIKQLNTRFTGSSLELVYATPSDIQLSLKMYSEDPKTVFDNLLKSGLDATKTQVTDPPIIQIVDTIIRFAYENGASDIHLEPTSENSLVRFRIDGVMQDIVTLPLNLHSHFVTRIKVMSNLKTDESHAPQDGKLHLTMNEHERLDVRVSIVPIVNGENIVLRLLSEKTRQFSLLDLGLSARDTSTVDSAKLKPHGMILSTGPTGSGKTTTLYALLKTLNSRHVNIMTIEDPVEYEIDGISQIQVNKATSLTFADGLKSIVRQDPDIILVGEIRDEETASIATNSAMTGHLVLSSLHTNDSATTIPRLIDMHIEPFLIASTVNIIIAQRLVRKICTKCRVSKELPLSDLSNTFSSTILAKHFTSETIRIYEGQGCPSCQNMGYSGRIGIFEIMTISDKIKQAIIAKSDATQIQNLAIAQGMTTMLEDGLEKVKNGITTIEEILRVTKE